MIRYPSSATNAAAKSVVIATGAYRLLHVIAYNANVGDMYLQVFDAAALPANGTVPTLPPVRIPTTDTGTLDLGIKGYPFATGIVAALSSTAGTLTIAAANDGIFSAAAEY